MLVLVVNLSLVGRISNVHKNETVFDGKNHVARSKVKVILEVQMQENDINSLSAPFFYHWLVKFQITWHKCST
jgi:hypothetical protein